MMLLSYDIKMFIREIEKNPETYCLKDITEELNQYMLQVEVLEESIEWLHRKLKKLEEENESLKQKA